MSFSYLRGSARDGRRIRANMGGNRFKQHGGGPGGVSCCGIQAEAAAFHSWRRPREHPLVQQDRRRHGRERQQLRGLLRPGGQEAGRDHGEIFQICTRKETPLIGITYKAF